MKRQCIAGRKIKNAQNTEDFLIRKDWISKVFKLQFEKFNNLLQIGYNISISEFTEKPDGYLSYFKYLS